MLASVVHPYLFCDPVGEAPMIYPTLSAFELLMRWYTTASVVLPVLKLIAFLLTNVCCRLLLKTYVSLLL